MADPDNAPRPTPAYETAAALAKRRYFTMQAVRLVGIAAILTGIYLRQAAGMDIAVPLLLVLAGGALFIVIPRMLARRWRSPKA
ncbi:hypothetical protein [Paraurantiacibacter namhicola]|uniref:Uncharacterized protein n=1 Tax=Paraurantiacibacter namhicola TaxID=645517 RepID=A0A1C7DB34_9SPHN|nr:hypothetical protein [Paraurantiacibacter namhicola]ANU08627.1 hypothetical protein A6F65_02344 [Paraurantiacibacter namhicola]